MAPWLALYHPPSRAYGFRSPVAASIWLAARRELPGAVLDTQGWTGLYTGRETYPYEEAPAALSDPLLVYLVVQRDEFTRDSARSRTLRWLIETAAQPAAEFPHPATRKANQATVVVYRWYPDRFHRHLAARPTRLCTGENRRAQADSKLRG